MSHAGGQRTDAIPYDATPELLEYFLERLSTVTDVDVKRLCGAVFWHARKKKEESGAEQETRRKKKGKTQGRRNKNEVA